MGDYELTENKKNWSWRAAVDAEIFQKILPKLHGARKRIEPLLIDLAQYCETGKAHPDAPTLKSKFDIQPVIRALVPGKNKNGKPTGEDPVAFRHSYEKLCDMIDAVRRDQFVSFIQ